MFSAGDHHDAEGKKRGKDNTDRSAFLNAAKAADQLG